jgi:NodT family efflux transporter outer membrane factor (OMF) lipoprotein
MNQLKHALTPLATALFLAGCAVGPDFKAPQPNVPEQWSRQADSTAGTQTQNWWSTFNDNGLTSLIERAAASNLDVRQAALRVTEARAQRDVAAAARWPQLSANAGYQRQRISENTTNGALLGAGKNFGFGVPNPSDQYQLGFDASWEVDLFGRVRRSVEAADADEQASVEDHRDVLVTLFGDVGRTYVELRGAQLRASITRGALATQRDLLELTQQRQSVGLANDLDVSNAAALAANTEAQLPLLERQITQDVNQLSKLMGREPGALRSELEATQPVPPTPAAVPIGLPAELARRRPDIRRVEAKLHAATARVGVAVADLFPRLTLNASAGFQAQDVPDLTDWASRFLTAGPRLEIPIFSGGQRRATLQLQDVRAQEAAIDYARTVLGALHEVENALAAYGAEQDRHRSLETAVAHSRDALQLAQQRYESGVSSFLEVLDAERNVQQNELSLADSTTSLSTNLVALYKALGGGWESSATLAGR